MTSLDLTGLTTMPAQVWGAVRLVPLVREAPVDGLRLRHEIYGPGYGEVETGPRSRYLSYIPHGFVADWSGDGGRSAAYGTQLGDAPPACVPVRRHHRLAKRQRQDGAAERRLRFLPLHLALDGYLSLHFGGPSVVWDEWSQRAVRQGLSPRAEAAYTGRQVRGLAEALRVFEIHPGQCGVLVYTADALAAAFVVPHPADYRALHPSLIEDLYGEVVHQYALFGGPVPDFETRLRDRSVTTLTELRAAAREAEREWARSHDTLLAGRLLDASYRYERVYAMEAFTLWRFLPSFRRGEPEQHIGEVITDHKGRAAYLKTFRLSDAQIRRGYLLDRLHDHDWHPGRTAEAMGTTLSDLVRRITDAGFASLLKHGAETGRIGRNRAR
ncbi:ARPP-2 domain-containing protein [Streptomyces sp. NPDC020965]|uniref:ARPP-2 domain-containing protein n=1 Tax=Streptomyces sp. NPDC020965 TaxID=3365105 RepID=UPI0037BBA41E